MAHTTPTFCSYVSPAGQITLATDGCALTNLAFGSQGFPGENKPTELTNLAATQLQEYFAGKRKAFDVPLAPLGTDFQQQVWEGIRAIPYGETMSYLDLAEALGNESSAKAIGLAANKNPLPLIIPSHRLVGTSGKPTGSADVLRAKEFLIELERKYSDDGA